MARNAATTDALDLLHKKLAEQLQKKLNAGDATAADLELIRKFLKDNGVEAAPVAGTPLGDLAEDFPFQPQDVEESLPH